MTIKERVVIRFSGDSGDGMQLTGSQFTHTSAQMGNDFATFPDFPAEIRAPQGTVAGVSGFQINFGSKEIHTPGDEPDVLVAMNPAALKANIDDLKLGGVLIVNNDTFTDLGFKKAGLKENPLPKLDGYRVIEAHISEQTKEALKAVSLDPKSKLRSKNFYALGMTYFMYNRKLEPTIEWIEEKFHANEELIRANQLALKAGYNFAETIGAHGEVYSVPKSSSIEKGIYRQINGNTALAWGLMLGAQKANTNLFLGSYPITPASDILHELSKHKNFGVKSFQAEDEMAAICAAIGASYTGALGITTSSGPGIALKSEALNLAIMLELPLIVINIQRGGPSTGLPTKTEQSDLNMMMFGRNGESPAIILAAKSPANCFEMAYEAARLTLEHMTPVILMSDGYIANGSTPWKIPDIEKEFPEIQKRMFSKKGEYLPYQRDAKTLVRSWVLAGEKNNMHRIGGLEKEIDTGNVSYDPENHEKMVLIREEKVRLVENNIPLQKVTGDEKAKIAIVSWGGTHGTISEAVKQSKLKVAHIHIQYLNPFPKNLGEVLKKYKHIVVCELNRGQLLNILNGRYHLKADGYHKVQGKPFKVREILQLIDSVGEKHGIN